ncbi:MAG: type VI secretion system-associated protein TagF [Deltaproteobacteria bacterium]|nr:type VI secretion system-associated protein TagF [Deltaproteobacteria bacterium]
MLGQLGFKQHWQWGVCGKHPSASDYFRLGHKNTIFDAFGDWVEKGYRSIAAKKDSVGAMLSWRFWVRGSGNDAISCGILKDSIDQVGRPYPLMILGSGRLQGWQSRWCQVQWACEKTWNQMEAISTRKYRDLRFLEEEVTRLRDPDPHWPDYEKVRLELEDIRRRSAGSGRHDDKFRFVLEIEDKVMDSLRQSEILVSMNENPFWDRFFTLHIWQHLFQLHLKEVPKVVFMGGSSQRTYLALFRRALNLTDFVSMWSVP